MSAERVKAIRSAARDFSSGSAEQALSPRKARVMTVGGRAATAWRATASGSIPAGTFPSRYWAATTRSCSAQHTAVGWSPRPPM